MHTRFRQLCLTTALTCIMDLVFSFGGDCAFGGSIGPFDQWVAVVDLFNPALSDERLEVSLVLYLVEPDLPQSMSFRGHCARWEIPDELKKGILNECKTKYSDYVCSKVIDSLYKDKTSKYDKSKSPYLPDRWWAKVTINHHKPSRCQVFPYQPMTEALFMEMTSVSKLWPCGHDATSNIVPIRTNYHRVAERKWRIELTVPSDKLCRGVELPLVFDSAGNPLPNADLDFLGFQKCLIEKASKNWQTYLNCREKWGNSDCLCGTSKRDIKTLEDVIAKLPEEICSSTAIPVPPSTRPQSIPVVTLFQDSEDQYVHGNWTNLVKTELQTRTVCLPGCGGKSRHGFDVLPQGYIDKYKFKDVVEEKYNGYDVDNAYFVVGAYRKRTSGDQFIFEAKYCPDSKKNTPCLDIAPLTSNLIFRQR